MTLRELKELVDALMQTQSPELETNVIDVRVRDHHIGTPGAGYWRKLEVVVSSAEVGTVEVAAASMAGFRDRVEQRAAAFAAK